MLKKLIGILLIVSLIGIIGCSSVPKSITPTSAASVKTIRESEISSKWTVKQLEVNLESSLTMWLILAEGDKVDGYYYLENGDSISFNITGKSLVYESPQPVEKSATLTSDRFSFTAGNSQGIAYGLTFSVEDVARQPKGTKIFMELIYPVTGTLNFPDGTK